MSIKIVFIIIAIIFYVVKQLNKNKEEVPMGSPAKPAKQVGKTQKSSSQKSIDDIFNEFVKEVGGAKKKEAKPVQVAQKKIASKGTLDWQKVSHSNIKAKLQLINHDDYHGVSHRVDKAHQIEGIEDIKSSEGKVFNFDKDEIDWHNAIIYKEILDRKYV